MKFSSKTEAYSYIILILTLIEEKFGERSLPNLNVVRRALNDVKIAMENHEQNIDVIWDILEKVKPLLGANAQEIILALQHDLKSSDYQQTPLEKFQNPLARRAESELAIQLLKKPTNAMMIPVHRVSLEIIKLMEDYPHVIQAVVNDLFIESGHFIALGAPKKSMTISEIKTLLKKNDPAQFIEIMHMHFKFGQSITRFVGIKRAPVRKPVGKLLSIIQKIYKGEPEDFFKSAIFSLEQLEMDYRSYISNIEMYASPLFMAVDGKRGRGDKIDPARTNYFGLMLKGQDSYALGLGEHSSSWVADCKSQSVDLNSPYVIDLIENDAVYVAGPSGMTSVLLNQMEILANFENENLKKNYLSAIVSYIVGGGFHSFHEVIGPAQYSLDLVPGYIVEVPKEGKLAAPPNYNQFFSQQALIDPEFNERRAMAWRSYLYYFNVLYGPKHCDDFSVQTSRFKKLLSRELDVYPSLVEKSPSKEDATDTQQKDNSHTRFLSSAKNINPLRRPVVFFNPPDESGSDEEEYTLSHPFR